jgi:predicted nucleic acid-binding protein
MKKKVYIETSIISFLGGRPSRNLLAAAWQSITTDWWENRRELFDLYVSELVLEEAGRGDEDAAQKRLKNLESIPLLAVTDSAVELSKKLLEQGALPQKATDDALHIALASVHNIDYLLTWNCRHIDNAETKPIVRSVIITNSYFCPEICTPQELMGGELNEK